MSIHKPTILTVILVTRLSEELTGLTVYQSTPSTSYLVISLLLNLLFPSILHYSKQHLHILTTHPCLVVKLIQRINLVFYLLGHPSSNFIVRDSLHETT